MKNQLHINHLLKLSCFRLSFSSSENTSLLLPNLTGQACQYLKETPSYQGQKSVCVQGYSLHKKSKFKRPSIVNGSFLEKSDSDLSNGKESQTCTLIWPQHIWNILKTTSAASNKDTARNDKVFLSQPQKKPSTPTGRHST